MSRAASGRRRQESLLSEQGDEVGPAIAGSGELLDDGGGVFPPAHVEQDPGPGVAEDHVSRVACERLKRRVRRRPLPTRRESSPTLAGASQRQTRPTERRAWTAVRGRPRRGAEQRDGPSAASPPRASTRGERRRRRERVTAGELSLPVVVGGIQLDQGTEPRAGGAELEDRRLDASLGEQQLAELDMGNREVTLPVAVQRVLGDQALEEVDRLAKRPSSPGPARQLR